ncbi:MAG: rhomboid family intramembrane serine protease [Symploca sp. SIO2E6]|nr:rhomboid family intramembrane serine protease [Symploca sp. SIO2E6]
MFKLLQRQTSGSIVCPSCGQLVQVQEPVCPQCGRRNPGIWGFARALRSRGYDYGFVSLVTWGCIGVYLATLLVDPGGIRSSGALNLLSPSGRSLLLFGATGSIPVFELGRFWTVLSCAWLHGGLLHIAFNLAWINEVGPFVAKLYGASRLVLIYTVAAMTGSVLTSIAGQYFNELPAILHGASLSIGASGGIFGLFGALVAYGQITSDSTMGQKYWRYAMILFLIGFILPAVDNWGHLGGFLGGYVISRMPWLNPKTPESHRQLLVAIACIILTLLSILASIGHGILLLKLINS